MPSQRIMYDPDEDVLADAAALTATWDEEHRSRLRERLASHVAAGAPWPAALMLALGDVLDD